MCVPLASTGGLVEWVLGTVTLKEVVRSVYTAMGVDLSAYVLSREKGVPEWQRAKEARKSDGGAALLAWYHQRLAVCPAAMHKWWLASCAPSPARPVRALPAPALHGRSKAARANSRLTRWCAQHAITFPAYVTSGVS